MEFEIDQLDCDPFPVVIHPADLEGFKLSVTNASRGVFVASSIFPKSIATYMWWSVLSPETIDDSSTRTAVLDELQDRRKFALTNGLICETITDQRPNIGSCNCIACNNARIWGRYQVVRRLYDYESKAREAYFNYNMMADFLLSYGTRTYDIYGMCRMLDNFGNIELQCIRMHCMRCIRNIRMQYMQVMSMSCDTSWVEGAVLDQILRICDWRERKHFELAALGYVPVLCKKNKRVVGYIDAYAIMHAK